jgi:hypothetical protein
MKLEIRFGSHVVAFDASEYLMLAVLLYLFH